MQKVPLTKRAVGTRGLEGDTENWLKDMAERDTQLWGCPRKLWIIDNRMYDLTQFADRHPGGKHWIQMTQGQDISTHFKVHHLDEKKVRGMLSKYEVGQCPKKHAPRFQFNETGYYDQLRQRILQKYSIQELQNTDITRKRSIVIIAIWIVLLTLAAYLKSYLIGVIAGCWMINFYSIGHLFIHKPNNWLKYVYIFLGMSPREQIIMHCLSHHMYPNTLLDYEFAALQPIVNFTRCLPKNSTFSYFGMQIIFALVVPANIITKALVAPLASKTRPSFVQSLALLQLLYIYAICGDFYFSLKLFLQIIVLYGVVFGVTIICPHRMDILWSEGAPQIRDFLLHSVATTSDMDHEVVGYESLIRYVGFNIHAIHHLFPTIDHNSLKKVNQIFLDFCKQKGIKIALNSQLECDLKLYKLTREKKQFDLKNFYSQ